LSSDFAFVIAPSSLHAASFSLVEAAPLPLACISCRQASSFSGSFAAAFACWLPLVSEAAR